MNKDHLRHANQLDIRRWVLAIIIVFVAQFSFSQNVYKQISIVDVFEMALKIAPDSTLKFENLEENLRIINK